MDIRPFGSWMYTPTCLFFQDFEGLTEAFDPGRPPESPWGLGCPRNIRPKCFLFGLLLRCFRSGDSLSKSFLQQSVASTPLAPYAAHPRLLPSPPLWLSVHDRFCFCLFIDSANRSLNHVCSLTLCVWPFFFLQETLWGPESHGSQSSMEDQDADLSPCSFATTHFPAQRRFISL